MGTYDKQVALAVRLITKYGQPVKVVKMVETPGANEWNAPTTVEELHDGTAVFLNYKTQTLAALKTVLGDVPAGTKKVLLSAGNLDLKPNLKMYIRDAAGVTWDIQNIDDLAPNGQEILYDCRVG